VSNDPVRSGADVGLTLQASRDAGSAIDRAAAEAVRRLGPEAPLASLVETAFRELVYELPLLFDRQTVFPITAARAISSHLRAHGWQPARPA
jgi:hypothetical protein